MGNGSLVLLLTTTQEIIIVLFHSKESGIVQRPFLSVYCGSAPIRVSYGDLVTAI